MYKNIFLCIYGLDYFLVTSYQLPYCSVHLYIMGTRHGCRTYPDWPTDRLIHQGRAGTAGRIGLKFDIRIAIMTLTSAKKEFLKIRSPHGGSKGVKIEIFYFWDFWIFETDTVESTLKIQRKKCIKAQAPKKFFSILCKFGFIHPIIH